MGQERSILPGWMVTGLPFGRELGKQWTWVSYCPAPLWEPIWTMARLSLPSTGFGYFTVRTRRRQGLVKLRTSLGFLQGFSIPSHFKIPQAQFGSLVLKNTLTLALLVCLRFPPKGQTKCRCSWIAYVQWMGCCTCNEVMWTPWMIANWTLCPIRSYSIEAIHILKRRGPIKMELSTLYCCLWFPATEPNQTLWGVNTPL